MQILSKRWRDIWALVPVLHFDLTEFADEFFALGGLNRFKCFVTQFLLSFAESSNLETFRLSCHAISDTSISDCVSMWIFDALKYNPKNIFIDFSGHNYLNLPDLIYTCESLEEIYLNICVGESTQRITPCISNLPKLRKLSLCNVYIYDDHMENLISGCPNLEILIVENCVMRISGIWCRSLKSLTIRGCHLFVPAFSISAPGLLYFSFVGEMESGIKLRDVCEVTHASICFDTGMNYNSDFLSNLLRVEDLKISSGFLKNVLEGESRKCPIFHNLKHLILGDCCMNCAFGSLSCFLEHTPKLEKLTLLHTEGIFEVISDISFHELLCSLYIDFFQFLKVEARNGEENTNILGWFHCENLDVVEIVCVGFDESAQYLLKCVMQSTKRLDGVKIILSKR
ncbi:hypothetical protein LUZ60_003646 [Juncus effusus]|nr:hypothetical protein LUZ60_003646 [Juncus effusus]